MITVEEASALIEAQAHAKPSELISTADALDLVLDETLKSDLDSPPWDKSMVDGYAIQASDLAGGRTSFRILEEVVAGAIARQIIQSGQATRVMTGAPIPSGCDAVVMVEKTTLVPEANGWGRVEIHDTAVSGQNILRRATAMRAGDLVLEPGKRLRPIEIGLLCELGKATVRVSPRASVAVLSTGNELVDVGQVPGPGQIRNSNGPMLRAAAQACGASVHDLGTARDELSILEERIAKGLEADVLVLSGGVSAGVLDLVPQVFEKLEVRKIFHKVQLKPGKPLWFGVHSGGGHQCLVFGLPGNPVSSLVCFRLFVRPAIARLTGRIESLIYERGRLTGPFRNRGDRPIYHPARTIRDGGELLVEPLRWQGSADIYGLTRADALVYAPAGDRHYEEGTTIDLLPL